MTQETLGLTQQDLESRLWAAANSLRGSVDPADFKASGQPGTLCHQGAALGTGR
jgi:hypothetical protein